MRGIESKLLTGIRTLWTGTAALTTAVPGGLWHERPPERSAAGAALSSPYARIKITAQPPEHNSGDYALQAFDVQIRVWSRAGPVDAGSIQRTIGLTFDPATGYAVTTGLTVADATVVRVKPTGGDFTLDDEREDALDILLADASWRFELWITK